MFDESELRKQLAIKLMTLTDYAEYLSISPVTLYRKMSGASDFKRGEINKSVNLFGKKTCDAIFFACKVSYKKHAIKL